MKELKNWIQKWFQTKTEKQNQNKPNEQKNKTKKTTWSLLQYSIYSTWNSQCFEYESGETGNEMNLLTRSSDSSIQKYWGNTEEEHWGLPHPGLSSCKMLCRFQFNTPVSRLSTLMGASWWSSNEFLQFTCLHRGRAVPGSNLHCPSETP